MRVAFFVDSFPVLSDTFILNQITGLIDKGHDVRIFSTSHPHEKLVHTAVRHYRLIEKTIYINDKPANPIFRLIRGIALFIKTFPLNPEIMRNTINFFIYGKNLFTLTLLYQAAAILKEGDFDIFYCHYWHNGELALRMKKLGFPGKIVTMFHGNDFLKKSTDKEKIFCELLKNGDAFLNYSQYTTDIIKTWKLDPVKLFYNPISLDINECGMHSHDRGVWRTLRVITVARLKPEKNISLGIRAVIRIVTEYGLRNFTYRIIGDGPSLTELKKQAKGAEKNISFGGPMTHNAVLEELNNSDIFLLTSNEEILPLSILEAHACGLPVITTDVGAVREIVQDDVSGFVVQKGDLSGITDKLAYLLTHSQSRRKMGERGRASVQSLHDINKFNIKLIEIFKTVLKSTDKTDLSVTQKD